MGISRGRVSMKVELAYVCQLMCTRSLQEHLWTRHNHFPFAIGSQFSLLLKKLYIAIEQMYKI